MNTWISRSSGEGSQPHHVLLAGESITALYLTISLAEADHLANEIHRIAPNLHLDVSLRVVHAIDRLKSGRHRVVLLDQRVSPNDRARLIAYIQREDLTLPIILISGHNEGADACQTSKAGADEPIIRCSGISRELRAVIERALTRNRTGDIRLAPAPLDSEDPLLVPEAPTHEKAVDLAPASEVPASTAPARCQGGGADNRTMPRYEVYIPCNVQWEDDSYDACIRDLSKGGAFVETTAPAPAGSVVGILLKLSSAELRLEATVTHYGWYMTAVRNFDGIGIQFRNLSGRGNDILRGLIARSTKPAPQKTPLER